MRTKQNLLSVLLAIVLLAIPTTVFAKELGLLTITGPGIQGELSLSSPDVMNKIMGAGFFDQTDMLSKVPENLGQGYTITAHLNLDGKMTPYIKLVYYPAEKGQPGNVDYIGRRDGSSMRNVNEWGKLSLSADNAFREVMTANNVTLQTAVLAAPAAVVVAAPEIKPEVQSAPATSSTTAPLQIPYFAMILALAVLAAFGAILLLRRRTISQRGT